MFLTKVSEDSYVSQVVRDHPKSNLCMSLFYCLPSVFTFAFSFQQIPCNNSKILDLIGIRLSNELSEIYSGIIFRGFLPCLLFLDILRSLKYEGIDINLKEEYHKCKELLNGTCISLWAEQNKARRAAFCWLRYISFCHHWVIYILYQTIPLRLAACYTAVYNNLASDKSLEDLLSFKLQAKKACKNAYQISAVYEGLTGPHYLAYAYKYAKFLLDFKLNDMCGIYDIARSILIRAIALAEIEVSGDLARLPPWSHGGLQQVWGLLSMNEMEVPKYIERKVISLKLRDC